MPRPLRVAHVATVDLSLRFLLLDQLQAQAAAGYEMTAISAPGPWVKDLEQAGIRHIPWGNAIRSWDPRADLRAARELAQILRRERFDLVHTHNPKPGIIGRLVARRVGVPAVVNTVHGLYSGPADRLRTKAPVVVLERLAAAASDLELYQSEEDLVWARRVGLLGATRSVLLGNGIDLDRFAPERVSEPERAALRDRLGIPRDAFVVGTVGRLVAEKGTREFFAAAREMRATDETISFLAVGDTDSGKSDAVSHSEIDAVRDEVIVTGWTLEVPELISIMDVFVLGSWRREGKPRSAMEAATLGKPLILTDVRGCREVARDGVEGMLIPPRDTGALVAAIERIRTDPVLAERLGSAARVRALREFDQRAVFDRVISEYRRLLVIKGLEEVPPAEPSVRAGRPDDRDALASLHAASLPGGFMTRLGPAFLRRFYSALLSDTDAVCIVAEADGQVVGFVCGVTSMPAFSRRFRRRHGVGVALAVAPKLRRPAVVRGLIEDLRYAGIRQELPEAEALTMAVAPAFRRSGLARRLLRSVVSELTQRGVEQVMLVEGAGNHAAERVFAGAGFAPARELQLHSGADSNIWMLACRS